METGSEVVTDWCSENESFDIGRAIRFNAAVSATVLLIVRRWWGIMSSFSSSSRSSRSDMGISSSSSSSSCSWSFSPAEESLSLSSMPAKSIYEMVNVAIVSRRQNIPA
jgi:hypothetical protein